ncbi:MAG: restriction endonuclease subunit R [Sphaerobacteraceae bacterium]|nr:MAG: restriction endonuclease subunit R [Sphaerobacteraceae bacterium]
MTERNSISVQRSGSIILDTTRDPHGEVEDVLRLFAELQSAAGNLHTYRVTDLSLWGAAASGNSADTLLPLLQENSPANPPATLVRRVHDYFNRYGQLRLESRDTGLVLCSPDPMLLNEAAQHLGKRVAHGVIPISAAERLSAKSKLAQSGLPVVENATHRLTGNADFSLNESVLLRDYQKQARDRFVESSHDGGVIILPCGAGKTVVGVSIATSLRSSTLVVTPNRTIGEQWLSHFSSLTTLNADDIDLFPSDIGRKPITIVTYQALTSQRNGFARRLSEAQEVPWGLVIYDEVHSLPADVFRQSAVLQSKRRLGLTATLVREDGRERDVYALVGPPIWQSRWRDLERQGWISPVDCYEVRVRVDSAPEQPERGFAGKVRTVERLLARHTDDQVLIAAHRRKEVEILSNRLGVPSVTGETPQSMRSQLYEKFKSGALSCLVVSTVANVGVDLPDANVLIQVSGTFGSRLEEAQRLGRLLRPKADQKPARFYSLVLPVTREREFAERRQRFLVDQGYRYRIVNVRG